MTPPFRGCKHFRSLHRKLRWYETRGPTAAKSPSFQLQRIGWCEKANRSRIWLRIARLGDQRQKQTKARRALVKGLLHACQLAQAQGSRWAGLLASETRWPLLGPAALPATTCHLMDFHPHPPPPRRRPKTACVEPTISFETSPSVHHPPLTSSPWPGLASSPYSCQPLKPETAMKCQTCPRLPMHPI